MNFQNIPRALKDVKRAFVPKQGAFSFFDYQKIEPRLLAYYLAVAPGIKDYTLVDVFADPTKNVYKEIVAPMLGKAVDDLEEEEYQRGKVQFLSLMYGGGARTIMDQFGLPYKDARKVVRSFHRAWPQIVELQESLLESHQRKGYIKTPWGRHLHMEPYGEHKLLNKLIQGSAAHLIKRALIKIDAVLPEQDLIPTVGYVSLPGTAKLNALDLKSHMVSVVHDEIILDGPEIELPELHVVIPPLMDDEIISAVVPIGVDHEVSLTNWAEKMDYSEWLETYAALTAAA